MSDSNSFGEENDGRSSPTQLGHGLPVVGVDGSSSGGLDDDNMDTAVPHHGDLMIHHHSSLDGEPDDDEDSEMEMSGGGGGRKKGKDDGKPQSKIKKKAGGSGRRRIEIKFIENKSRRQVTFSRRKRGLMKKVRSTKIFYKQNKVTVTVEKTNHTFFNFLYFLYFF